MALESHAFRNVKKIFLNVTRVTDIPHFGIREVAKMRQVNGVPPLSVCDKLGTLSDTRDVFYKRLLLRIANFSVLPACKSVDR